MRTRRRTNSRLLVAMLTLLLGFALLVARAVVVQVVHGPEYRAMAKGQQVRPETIEARRGVIYDRSGTVLAVSRQAITICANPRAIPDAAQAARRLAKALDRPATEIQPLLEGDRSFSTVARRLDPDVAQRILRMDLRGIYGVPEQKRVYPQKTLAAQLLGFVGVENKGLAGLEMRYDEILRGEAGTQRVVRDLTGRSLEVVAKQEDRPGDSLTLTIDQEIQFSTEVVLADTVKQYGAAKATAVVLDPKTGDVLAMANVPRIDANDYGKASPGYQRNMAVVDAYEPGSTFKMITVAGALEAGLVTPDFVFSLPRSIEMGGHTIREHDEDLPAVRELTVRDILAQSSNVGAIRIGETLGKQRLMETATRFGFGTRTGIDFPGEQKGIMPAEPWSASTMGNVPIGQGIAVTPLQIAAAYATVANDGVAMPPHLVRQKDQPAGKRVISAKTAAQLREMLTWTVDEGTGKAARLAGYKVAGKTGTAQKVVKGAYSKDEYVSSFVGMVPADDPRVVVLIVVDHPTTKHLGSLVAAPAFSLIAEFAMKHLEVPPTEDLGLTPPVTVPQAVSEPGE